MQQVLRIVTCGISGGRSLTPPLRDARRVTSTLWYTVPGASRTTLGFGICASFEGHFLSPRAQTLVLRFATCASLQVVLRVLPVLVRLLERAADHPQVS
jgi:hypothetical protein